MRTPVQRLTLLLAVVVTQLSLSMCLAAAPSEPDPAVEAGRQTLDRWWWRAYPWYDSGADGVRRIDFRRPWFLDWEWNWPWSWGGGSASGMGTLFEWIIRIALVAVLAVLVYMLVRAYLNRRGDFGFAAAADAEAEAADRRRRIESLPFPLEAARSDLLAEAQRRYQAGEYGEAVKYLFSHELVQLDKHRIIRLTRGKTNRQYLREVGSRASLRRTVEQTMVAFEDFFFGNHRIDRLRFEACWSCLPQFEAQLAEGAS